MLFKSFFLGVVTRKLNYFTFNNTYQFEHNLIALYFKPMHAYLSTIY